MCRLPLPEGWKSCCYRSGGRSSAFTGIIASPCINMCRLSFSTHWHCFHESVFLQVANNSGYIQVDWKRVEKDVNKAKKQLKKGTDQAVPELNTFVEKVILLWVVWLTVRSFSPSHYNEKWLCHMKYGLCLSVQRVCEEKHCRHKWLHRRIPARPGILGRTEWEELLGFFCVMFLML